MLRILEELLKKRQVKIENLEPDEKVQFDAWEKILSEGDISVEKIRDFCSNQLGIIKHKLKDTDNNIQKNERLILLFSVYDSLIEAISAPEKRRKELESYLYDLLDNK